MAKLKIWHYLLGIGIVVALLYSGVLVRPLMSMVNECTTDSDCPRCIGMDTPCVNGVCDVSEWCLEQDKVTGELKSWFHDNVFVWIQNNVMTFFMLSGLAVFIIYAYTIKKS